MFESLVRDKNLIFVCSRHALGLLPNGFSTNNLFADARSAAFFAFGKITIGEKAVLAIGESELCHAYTALTEAFMQKKPLPVVILPDGGSADFSFLKNCGTKLVQPQSDVEVRAHIEGSFSMSAPLVIKNGLSAPQKARFDQALFETAEEIARILGKDFRVFSEYGLHSGDLKANPEGFAGQYGLIAKYIGWCALSAEKSLLAVTPDQLLRDLNSLNLRYVSEKIKILVADSPDIPKTWLEGNAFKIIYIDAGCLDKIAENMAIHSPTVFILKGKAQ